MDNRLTLDTFKEYVGATFRVAVSNDEYLELELIEAEASRASPGAPRQDPFRLLFRGPADRYLPQRIYRLQNEKLGAVELFLIPRQPDRDGSYFEVVIN